MWIEITDVNRKGIIAIIAAANGEAPSTSAMTMVA